MDPMLAAVLSIIALLIVISLGIHIGISLALVGFLGLWLMSGQLSIALGVLTTSSYEKVTTYGFSALPLFIIMGIIAMYGGISDEVFDTAHKWIGRLPGGLAISTIMANAAFGAVTGSSAVSVTVFTKLALPPMLKAGYNKSLACGTILGGGMLGMLIPPSILAVLYGIITEQSIAQLLMAGVGPGLLLTVLFSLYIYGAAHLNPSLAPVSTESFTLKEKIVSLKGLFVTLFVGGVIVIGIYMGFFSPTEAGGFGGFTVIIIVLLRRRLTLSNFTSSILETTRVTAMLFLIFMTSIIYARFLALTGMPISFANWVGASGLPNLAIVGLFMLMYLFLGCLLDSISMMVITLPIVHPIIVHLGMDPIWFALCVIVAIEAGFLTPPVGLAIYNLKAVAGDEVDTGELFRACVPFFFGALACLVTIMLIPPIIVFIPNSMYGG